MSNPSPHSRFPRIATVGPTHPYRGGIAHHTTLLTDTLRNNSELLFVSFSRQYPKILFPGKSDREPKVDALEVSKVEYLIDSINPFTWVAAARRIAKFHPDILIFPWWVAFWAPQFMTIATLVKRLSGAKIVILCHNVLEHESGTWKKIATTRVLKLADRIITQSAQETSRAKELLGPDAPVTTGFHPTYCALCNDLPNQYEARSSLGIKGNVLLFFGFVRPYKGLDVLLAALPAVLRKRNATLLVVGEFWKDKETYLKQIQNLAITESVYLVDRYIPTDDIGNYFAAADLVVQPYHSATGSGITQLAYGLMKPVIATRVGNLDEVVDDGVNGRLVPPGDPAALAEAIIHSLDSEVLKQLTTHAATTRDRFSWERLVEIIYGTNGDSK